MIFIILIILFLLFSLLVVYIFKRYRRREQIPQSSIPIKLEENKESTQEKTEIEAITITKQTSNKTNISEQNIHKKHLIDEQAFQFNEDSDNEKDEERNSSGNQSSDHKQNHSFQFQEGEQKLDELIEPEN
ncbi:unnamed protein product [Paramecium sonneborni]|uniref:Uncharacterized protein n=1 Tax=Paramecium sonneborni TaxID=65129 RepID=A0A8S1KT04_9CILI|nr:unnamed protein product [Paramecium sonneborni]